MNVWFEFATQFAYFKLSPSLIFLQIWPRTGYIDVSGDYTVLAAIAENGLMKITVTI